MMPSGVPPMPDQQIGTGVGPARRDRARDVAVGDQPAPRAGVADICDQLLVPRPVQDAHRQVGHRHALGLGDLADVLADRGGDVDGVDGVGPDGDLVHVEHRRRVEHGAALGHCQHRDRVRQALAHQRRAVDRVDGEVAVRPVAVADLLAVVEHRRVVLLALADHHDAAHRHRVDQLAHRVDGGAVAALLVAAAYPAARRHRAGFGHPDELEGEVAVGGFPTGRGSCALILPLADPRLGAGILAAHDDAAATGAPSRQSRGCCRTAGTCSGRSRRWWSPASCWRACSACARLRPAGRARDRPLLRRPGRAAGRRRRPQDPDPAAEAARGLAVQLRQPQRHRRRPHRPVLGPASARGQLHRRLPRAERDVREPDSEQCRRGQAGRLDQHRPLSDRDAGRQRRQVGGLRGRRPGR